MQQDDARSARGLESGLKDMRDYLIDCVDPARTNPPWKRGLAVIDTSIVLRGGYQVGAGLLAADS
jgi:hypothetical protein